MAARGARSGWAEGRVLLLSVVPADGENGQLPLEVTALARGAGWQLALACQELELRATAIAAVFVEGHRSVHSSRGSTPDADLLLPGVHCARRDHCCGGHAGASRAGRSPRVSRTGPRA